jgi:soluble lytic murein transglycosylase
MAARAVRGFAIALAAGRGRDSDRFAYATALADVGRDRDAAAQFARVRPPSRLAGAAAYQRARSLMRVGTGTAGRRLLRQVPRAFPKDTAPAAAALYLLGDLATDDRQGADARAAFRELARRYPTSGLAARARLRAALIAFAADSAPLAARELDSLASGPRAGDERLAAAYWAGRAWAAAGDSGRARGRWREVAERDPLSYYAMASAARLGALVWAPAAASDTLPRSASVDSAMARAELLEELGMDAEAGYEYARLRRDASPSVARLLATASAFDERGMASSAMRLASLALDRGAPRTAVVYRLVYPLAYGSLLAAESRARQLDPALVAALVRQESHFTARATSSAGARGLMQVLPSVGRRIARALAYPLWDPVLLYQPDVNVEIGTVHLAGAVVQYPHPAYALAAYNAGDSRVARWRRAPELADPELFVERIPYPETRDYVRAILRTREMYRALYGW